MRLNIANCPSAPVCPVPRTRRPASFVPFLFLLIAGCLAPTMPCAADGNNVDLPRYPSISPDGGRIVFTWRGDLWKAPSIGGTATRLTSHPADEVHSVWSRDGRSIAFTSSRTGNACIWLMNADGTNLRQITDIDRDCTPTGFSVDDDGRTIVTLHASLEGDVYREFRPYMVATTGGDLTRLHPAFGSWPSVSPDRGRIAFVRGGYYDREFSRRHYRGSEASNIWTFDRARGTFARLTSWNGNDRSPRWSNDRSILFLSDRELDCVNLYRMDPVGGEGSASRLTAFTDQDVQHFDVAADGQRVVLSVWDTLYTLDLDDDRAVPRALSFEAAEDAGDDIEMKSIDRNVTEAALSPDGVVTAMIAYGEVYVRNNKEKSPTRRVTTSHAREKDVVWSPDGLRLFFTSDSDGTESIYAAAVTLTRGEIKAALAPLVAPAGDGEADEADEDEAEPDVEGDAGDEDGDGAGDEDSANEGDADEKKDDDLPPELNPDRWHDAIAFRVEPVVARAVNDRMPSPSPDGTMLAFRGTRGNLHIMDLETREIRTLIESWDAGIKWRWSPDSRRLAIARSDLDFNRDIFIAAADGSGKPVNVTRHPDDDENPRFSADGRILSFISERVNEEYDLWMVHLDAALERLTPLERAEYYEKAGEAAKKRKPLPVRRPEGPASDDENEPEVEGADASDQSALIVSDADLETAYLRVKRIIRLDGMETNHLMTPAGDRFVFVSDESDEPGVYSVNWEGKEKKKLADSGSVQGVSLTGDKVLIVTGDRAATTTPSGGDLTYLDISDRIRIDLEEQSSQKFLEAARGLGENYYHPTMNGVDWPAATARYHALARTARTAEEFNWVANRFIGELNGSHLRIVAQDPAPSNRRSHGRLGTLHRRVPGGFEVTGLVPFGPAVLGPMALRVGDVITAIEFEPFGPTDTIESMLKDRADRETAMTIMRRPGVRQDARGEDVAEGIAEEAELVVLLTPISYNDESQLKYEAWRRENARLVFEWSGGRIGYIHIQGMNQPSLDVFERDLFAAANEKDGLVIDVRNNGGGWTTDRVLSSIMVQPHAYTIPRGAEPSVIGHYPQPRLFIQRYTQPMNLLCNEKSYSNAEIMSHAFKTLKRGTLVGEQTHGSVISTGGWPLIDGTWVRLPFRGWYVNGGMDMELNGAIPDLLVPQTPEAEALGVDEQLRAAVDDLLGRLD